MPPPPARQEALLALVLGVLAQAEVWTDASFAGERRPLAVLAAVTAAAVAWRVRAPLAALAVCGVAVAVLGFAIDLPGSDPLFTVLPLLIAIYSAGAHLRGPRAVAGAALTAAVAVAALLADEEGVHAVGDVLFYALIAGGPWLAGVAIRLLRQRERSLATEAARLELEGELRARQAVTEERARISRELHDVVAHGISVIVLQARGGRHALDHDPAAARGAFDAIEQAGREALAEMRRLLDMLRAEDDDLALAPQPSLRNVGALAAQVSEAGLPVTVAVDGPVRDLPAGVDLSAYRIVQEALTNALRHAGPATAHVRVCYGADAVELEIADTGRGAAAANGGGGHGLVGMRERARLYGGEVEAAPAGDGGFRVRARLPLEPEGR